MYNSRTGDTAIMSTTIKNELPDHPFFDACNTISDCVESIIKFLLNNISFTDFNFENSSGSNNVVIKISDDLHKLLYELNKGNYSDLSKDIILSHLQQIFSDTVKEFIPDISDKILSILPKDTYKSISTIFLDHELDVDVITKHGVSKDIINTTTCEGGFIIMVFLSDSDLDSNLENSLIII